ncbi:MAG: glycosyltransferase, partial [Nanoarchaeota archaeon]|nr:glycosyltransferase [Nanoarchaeota archaeon]
MSKKRVLHVIDHLGLGGARTIVETLIKKGPENYYLYSLRKSANEPIFTRDESKRVFIHKNELRYNISCLFELKKIVLENKIEVIHLHLEKSVVMGYLLMKFFNLKVKVVIHEHGAIFMKKLLYFKVLKLMEKYDCTYIAVSNATKDKLIEKAKIREDKIKVLYNFIDSDKFKIDKTFNIEKEKKKLGVDNGDFIIGFVGRLDKIKSIDTIIKAVKKLDFKYKLLIAGVGPERENLELLIKSLKLDKKVLFLGYRADILNVYRLFDVCVLASKSEASTMTFYETQALGIPLIGSNVYAINEFIKDNKNGLLFEYGNDIDLSL